MFKFYLALWVAKFSSVFFKILAKVSSRKGTNLPGQLALNICPDFLSKVGKPEKIIAVTGTNGKTTTANFVSNILEDNGKKVINNRAGSNIASGVATALLGGVGLFNKTKGDVAVLEVDERSAPRVFPYVHPDYFVITNLLRDTTNREPHPHFVFDLFDKSLPDTTTMVLNGDDILASRLKKNNKRLYYGIDSLKGDRDSSFNIINDMKVCPECFAPLEYSHVRYNHIGKFRCPSCGLSSPEADFRVTDIDYEKHTMVVKQNGADAVYPLVSESSFHLYDELAAIAVLRAYGLTDKQVSGSFSKLKVLESRYREDIIGGIKVVAHMAKGQTAPACSVVFDHVRSLEGKKEIVLAIEDAHKNIHSSENMAFLYDTDFEFLNDDDIEKIIVVGVRAHDILCRLLLAGIPAEKIKVCPSEDDILDVIELREGLDVYILYEVYQIVIYDKIKAAIKRAMEGNG